MTTETLRQFFARVSYRPGWSFTIHDERFEGPHLQISCDLEDAYHPGETVPLRILSPLPPMATEEQLTDWLAWRLARIEVHEMREWLRVDGAQAFNPHDGIERT